ncbi:MAG: hypothetical protein AABX34_07080 [Nanoarchaeota archaeon]
MFWLKKQSDTERKISQMHSLLARSFSNVKRDTQNIFQWLNFLHQKNMQQENKIEQLELELSYIPKKPEDIRRIIDGYYSFESITEKIKALNEKIEGLKARRQSEPVYLQQPSQIIRESPQLEHIEQRLKQLEEQRKATIREKVVQRVTRNSKDYVTSLILSYIRKYSQIGALQLKDMVVHDQGLCSKSSFYRMLDEIEASGEASVVRQGKQKYYLYKQVREH